jgi:hypothetical protein
MTFLIAETFTDSLGRLTAEEQKAAKTTAFDMQMNPANPGLSFHRLDKARDKRFWSVRVGADLRLIVHRDETSLMLCYVDHHDRAYDWAERRKIEVHPKTGAAQIVEVRETVKEIVVPVYVQGEPETVQKKPAVVGRIFAGVSDDGLLGYGVPVEWCPTYAPSRATRPCSAWWTTCLPKPQRRFSNWPRVGSPRCLSWCLPAPARSSIRMPSVDSASWRTWRNCSRRSSTPGTSGPSSYTRSSVAWSSVTTLGRLGSPGRLGRGRR